QLKLSQNRLCWKSSRHWRRRVAQLCSSNRRRSRSSCPKAFTTRKHESTSCTMVSHKLCIAQTRFILSLKCLFEHRIMPHEMGPTASATTTICQSRWMTITNMPPSVSVDVKRERKCPQISGLIQFVSWLRRYRESPTDVRSWYR